MGQSGGRTNQCLSKTDNHQGGGLKSTPDADAPARHVMPVLLSSTIT